MSVHGEDEGFHINHLIGNLLTQQDADDPQNAAYLIYSGLLDAIIRDDTSTVHNCAITGLSLDQQFDEDINKAYAGLTPLSLASSLNKIEVVKILLHNGADINFPSAPSNTTALMRSAHEGHYEIVRILLENGADVHAETIHNNTALTYALSGSKKEDVIRLLLQYKVNVNHKNDMGMNALLSVSEGGDPSLVGLVLQHGADTESVNMKGNSALHLAVLGKNEMVKTVLSNNELTNQNTHGAPLDEALREWSQRHQEFFGGQGRLDQAGEVLHALNENDKDILARTEGEAMMMQQKIKAMYTLQRSRFEKAKAYKNTGIMDQMLSSKEDSAKTKNAKNLERQKGDIPPPVREELARISLDFARILKLLLNAGCNKEAVDSYGMSAIDLAISHADIESTAVLAGAGADPLHFIKMIALNEFYLGIKSGKLEDVKEQVQFDEDLDINIPIPNNIVQPDFNDGQMTPFQLLSRRYDSDTVTAMLNERKRHLQNPFFKQQTDLSSVAFQGNNRSPYRKIEENIEDLTKFNIEEKAKDILEIIEEGGLTYPEEGPSIFKKLLCKTDDLYLEPSFKNLVKTLHDNYKSSTLAEEEEDLAIMVWEQIRSKKSSEEGQEILIDGDSRAKEVIEQLEIFIPLDDELSSVLLWCYIHYCDTDKECNSSFVSLLTFLIRKGGDPFYPMREKSAFTEFLENFTSHLSESLMGLASPFLTEVFNSSDVSKAKQILNDVIRYVPRDILKSDSCQLSSIKEHILLNCLKIIGKNPTLCDHQDEKGKTPFHTLMETILIDGLWKDVPALVEGTDTLWSLMTLLITNKNANIKDTNNVTPYTWILWWLINVRDYQSLDVPEKQKLVRKIEDTQRHLKDNGASEADALKGLENLKITCILPPEVSALTVRYEHSPPETYGDLISQMTGRSAADDMKYICSAFIVGQCSDPDICGNMHFKLPFQWQYYEKEKEIWVNFPNDTNCRLEKEYCNPNHDSCFQQESFTIQFDETSVNSHTTYFEGKFRRLSTKNKASTPDELPFLTTWSWFWQEDTGSFLQYQDYEVIEKKFIANPCGEFPLENKAGQDSHAYISYFEMLQLNRVARRKRKIRRIPIVYIDEERINIEKQKKKKQIFKRPQSQQNDLHMKWDILSFSSSNGFCLEPIDKRGDTRKDYEKIEAQFFKTMDRNQVTITKIQRIQNVDLDNAFKSKKKRMEGQLSSDKIGEKLLFHGTKKQYIDAICCRGFDVRLSGSSHGSIYGRGSYFAKDAEKAGLYADSKQLFLARVLIGEYTEGRQDYIHPPLKDDGVAFDSCVDNLEDPSIFVVFSAIQAYPEFLVNYQ